MRQLPFPLMSLVVTHLATQAFSATIAGNALRFDGNNDFAKVPGALNSYPTTALTFEGWFWLDGNTTSAQDLIIIGSNDIGGSELYVVDNSNNVSFTLSNGQGSSLQPTTIVATQTWLHAAITYDGQVQILYVNGLERDRRVISSPIQVGDSDLQIGGDGLSDREYLEGMMDEVRVWNIARSPGDILANYDKVIDPSTSGLVGYWSFDESLDDQSIFDSSVFSNHGTLGASPASGSDDPVRLVSTAPIVPEPSTALLLGVASLFVCRRRRN